MAANNAKSACTACAPCEWGQAAWGGAGQSRWAGRNRHAVLVCAEAVNSSIPSRQASRHACVPAGQRPGRCRASRQRAITAAVLLLTSTQQAEDTRHQPLLILGIIRLQLLALAGGCIRVQLRHHGHCSSEEQECVGWAHVNVYRLGACECVGWAHVNV